MAIAQQVSSMVLGLRRKVNIKVRQPLQKIMIPVLNEEFGRQLHAVQEIIKTEINVKEIIYLDDASGVLVKKIKPDFKILGKKYGRLMKEVSAVVAGFTQTDIATIEKNGKFTLNLSEGPSDLLLEEVEIHSEDIPGWLVANDGPLTVALDITITDSLREEGVARELINRIQNLRKDSGFDVTDKIEIKICKHPGLDPAVRNFGEYIGNQTLAVKIDLVDHLDGNQAKEIELDDNLKTFITVNRI
jgi:isoleucyl-tRNA synthetase